MVRTRDPRVGKPVTLARGMRALHGRGAGCIQRQRRVFIVARTRLGQRDGRSGGSAFARGFWKTAAAWELHVNSTQTASSAASSPAPRPRSCRNTAFRRRGGQRPLRPDHNVQGAPVAGWHPRVRDRETQGRSDRRIIAVRQFDDVLEDGFLVAPGRCRPSQAPLWASLGGALLVAQHGIIRPILIGFCWVAIAASTRRSGMELAGIR